MSLMMRRFDDFREHVDRRMGGLEKRVDAVYGEVSSIKTDIVKMMRETLEGAYGGRRG
jgi:tetrahydromethanopterin S-methyltransferase subunit G